MVVVQHEILLETVHYVIDFCHQNKVPVILNPAPAAKVPLDIVDKVTFLTPNEREAELIFGKDISLEELLKNYPEKLIVTRGEKGVSAVYNLEKSLQYLPENLKLLILLERGIL